ncbi:PD-(D/E)XK nuclease family protein [Cellulosimicrobium sp. Marseille-Q4280]|uniref:RecB family exonuclease n=1 Tax=Cellulosimicrobium sp. Marseille-Q4280 TaxID=2937992 RepID=UPI002040C66C|nr:PD-(D/E)XK nuclease family protein [Cellulosimicrobium sp. Marseille-Q4280]
MTTPELLYQGDRLAWDAGHLVVTDPALLARLDKPHLSASTAKAVHSCPARLVGEKAIPQATDIFSATEKGTAAHLVLERLYELAPGRRDKKHAAKILTDMLRLDPEPDQVDYAAALGADPVRHTEWIAMVSAAYSGIFTIEDPASVAVYEREMRLDGFEVAGVPFKGFIDRVDGDPETGLKVKDYKTGKDGSRPNPRFSDDHGDQIRLYYAALLAKLGVKAVEGALYYIEHGTQRTVDLSPRAVDRTKAGFVQSWTDLRASVASATFKAKPSALCGWCPIVNACPVAREKRKDTDPRDSKASAIDLGIPTLRPVGAPLLPGADAPAQAAPAPAPLAPAAAVAEPARAAHLTGEGAQQGATHQTKEDPMTATTRGAREEDKSWVPTVGGLLNLNSYAAMGTIGLAALSAELLSERKADLDVIGVKMTPASLRALTAVLSRVVLAAQSAITNGSTDWAEGANTRVRGALRSVIVAIPLPFGGDADAWAKWETRAATMTRAIVTTGIDLFDGALADQGVDALLPQGIAPAAAPAA